MNSKFYMILANQLKSKSNNPQISLKSALIGTFNGVHQKRKMYYYASNQVSLYAKLAPLGNPKISLKPEIEEWVNKGKKVRFAECQRIIHDFRKRRRYTHALEVLEWMHEKGDFKFTSTEYAVQLDLIGRVRGILSAESYFNSLPDIEKDNKTYGALLNCYAQQQQVDKSLALFQKMKEMGFATTALAYNNIMCLYTTIGQYDKVPDVLSEMKKNKVLPDNYSYRLCLNSYIVKSDIEAVNKCLKEAETQPHMALDWNTYAVVANFYIKVNAKDKAAIALKKTEARLDNKDSTGYRFLISFFAKLGDKDGILRLWELGKKTWPKCINMDYITVLESLVKIGALEEAEEVLKGWELSDNIYDFRVPNVVISGYLNKGFSEIAEKMLNELVQKGRACSPRMWSRLAALYQEKGEMHKAMSSMRVSLSFQQRNKWSSYDQNIDNLLNWIGDHGSLEDAESFVKMLRSVFVVNISMYHALLKAYIRNGKNVDELLEKMKADKLEEDEKTKMILDTMPRKP